MNLSSSKIIGYQFYLKKYSENPFTMHAGCNSLNFTITNDPNFNIETIHWKVRLIEIRKDGTIKTTRRRRREEIQLTFNDIRYIFYLCYKSFPQYFDNFKPEIMYKIIYKYSI